MDQIAELKEMIQKSNRIVFLGGAGVSTESGIPDFRSKNGVFQAIQEFGYPPETLISHTFFLRNTKVFYQYYRKFLLYPGAKPNAAHEGLAKLEWGANYDKRTEKDAKPCGKLTAICTQNIDNLHQMAGSRKVLELHGSVYRNYCMTCRREYSMDELLERIDASEDGIPRCDCGSVIKPDVVLYEEGLDSDVLSESVNHIAKADLMIIGGTSLMVYPAAGLCDYFRGDNIVVLNLSDTARETGADLVIRKPIGETFTELFKVLEEKDFSH